MGKRKKIEKQLAVYKKMQKGFLHILLIVLVCFGMVQMGELQEVYNLQFPKMFER